VTGELLEYYKSVQGCYRIAEESHASGMAKADLPRKYIDMRGRCVDIAGGTGFNGYSLETNPESIAGKLAIVLSELGTNADKSFQSYSLAVITDKDAPFLRGSS
jgi:hypothetical protein